MFGDLVSKKLHILHRGADEEGLIHIFLNRSNIQPDLTKYLSCGTV